MKNNYPIALLCGVPPMCDRCGEEDAQVQIKLPNYGQRCMCGKCVTLLIERGFERDAVLVDSSGNVVPEKETEEEKAVWQRMCELRG